MKPSAATASPPFTEALERARNLLDAGKLDAAFGQCEALLAENAPAPEALALAGEIEYRRGNAEAASAWFEKALARDRRHPRANWLLGNVSQDRGSLDRAIASYRRALRADAKFVEAHNDLGTAYFAKGWLQEAEQCYRKALELDPDNLAATQNLASALRAQGRFREARSAFARTLMLRLRAAFGKLVGRTRRRGAPVTPGAAESAIDGAIASAKELLEAKRLTEAEQQLERLLAANPDQPQARHLLGRTLAARGKRAEAIPHFRRAIELRSSAPEFYVSLGNALTDERRYQEALENYQTALSLDPGSAAATANIARVLHELGHFREAEEVFRLSLQHEPDLGDAHCNHAGTLLSLGKYPEAEKAARTAIGLNAKSLQAHLMLATSLIEQGRIDDALEVSRTCESLDASNAEVLRWIGAFHMAYRGDLAAAESYLRRARSLSPDNPGIHINLARLLLIQERFEEGWEEYEWRRRESVRAYVYTSFPYPEWRGEPLDGKALLINGEQGLGDEVMFASLLREAAAPARRCILLCNRRLEKLFRRSFPFVEVIGGSHRGELDPFPVLQGVDYQVAAGSLPRAFRRRASEFPRHGGYLKADDEKVARWRERLAALGPGMKVGLSWKGGTPLSDETRRTLELDRFEPFLALPGTQWISLQFGDCAAERASWTARRGIALHHWQDAIDDLDETAALICALDLRITVCNTQVHLSGALGKEVWVLAPLFPDWRYGFSGEGMHWYPAARLFRQPKAGDWSTPLAQAQRELAARIVREQAHED